MTEKKPRTRPKLPTKATKTAGKQQLTLLTLFGKSATQEVVVETESEPEGNLHSEPESIIDVVSSSPPPISPKRITGNGKRPRQEEQERSPPQTALSTPSSTASRATSPSRTAFGPITADPYSSLRRPHHRLSISTGRGDSSSAKKRPLFAAVRKSRSRPTLDDTPLGSQEHLTDSQEVFESQEVLEGSQDAPIEIEEDEPEPEPVVPLTNAVVHAFFQPRKGKGKERAAEGEEKAAGSTSAGRTRFGATGLDAPWLSAETLHVMGRQGERLGTKPCHISRRMAPFTSTALPILDEQTRVWAKSYSERLPDQTLDLSISRVDAWSSLRKPESTPDEAIPEEHAKHPAITRLLGSDGAKYAFAPPARACEVLGNEKDAQRLADWMKQLELRRETEEEEVPTRAKRKRRERRVIVTEVDRRKRRLVENQNEYDPMIVDDGLDDDPEDVVTETVLGNTFVITGPQGTGKSAAVHACAQELGWSVFEIYTGIGRRGIGANGLASLVGSVGANHTVGRSEDGGVQQSLILLDEVDIIFEQDIQFWAAITRVVRESRRPVVIVANDLESIPRETLPVHRYVEFQAADTKLAASYLYAQAQATGCARVPSWGQFERLFKATASAPLVPGFAVPDEPQYALSAQVDRSPDLRRALEDMKFWLSNRQEGRMYADHALRDVRDAWAACGKDVVESVGDWSAQDVLPELGRKARCDESGSGKALYSLWEFADSVSVVDAGLERRWVNQMQAEEVDRLEPSDDDEVREHQLCKPPVRYEQIGISEFYWDSAIAFEAVCGARRMLERRRVGEHARAGLERRRGWDNRRLSEERDEHTDKLATFLHRDLWPLLPRPLFILDVIPAMRAMIAADDQMVAEAEAGETRMMRGRNTRMRAAGKVQHERYIPLKAAGAVAVRETAFAEATRDM